MLKLLHFAKARDVEAVGGLYRCALEDTYCERRELDVSHRGWGDEEVAELGQCLQEVHCPYVTTLDMRGNAELRSAQSLAWIGALPRLESLELRDCGLTSLPEAIGKLASLTKLLLSGCRITSLPDSLARLTTLRVLNFSAAEIGYMPDLSKLTELRVNAIGLGQTSLLKPRDALRPWEESGRVVWQAVKDEDEDEDNDAFWAAMKDG